MPVVHLFPQRYHNQKCLQTKPNVWTGTPGLNVASSNGRLSYQGQRAQPALCLKGSHSPGGYSSCWSISAVGTALGTVEWMPLPPCDLQTYIQSSITVMAFTAKNKSISAALRSLSMLNVKVSFYITHVYLPKKCLK